MFDVAVCFSSSSVLFLFFFSGDDDVKDKCLVLLHSYDSSHGFCTDL